MIATDAISPSLLIQKIAEASRTPIWILAAALIVGLLWGLNKLYKPGGKLRSQELKWAALLALLILPFNYLGNLYPFDGQIITSSGSLTIPVMALFVTIPFMAAVGLIGPIPAVILAMVSGMLQAATLGQDWMTGFVYTGLALAFTWFSSRTEWKGSRTAVHAPFVNALVSFTYVIPLIVLIQFANAFTYGVRDLMEIFEQSLLVICTIFPELLISALVCQGLSRFMPEVWAPLRYSKETVIRSPISQAIRQIEILTNGKYDQPIEVEPKSKPEENLYKSLENLRHNLQLRNDTQSRLLSLDPSYSSREAYDLVLASILRAALGRDASSARLILLNHSIETAKPEMRLRIGQGEQTRLYAYLDVMILDKIGDQDQLILSDLKVDQYFGLTSGMPYPQSIAALQLKHEGVSQGILWVGFEQNHWFSQDDIRFYQQLAYRASAVLSTKEQFAQVQADKNWLETSLDALPEPILVFNKNDQLIFSNQAASELISQEITFTSGSQGRKELTDPELKALLKKITGNPESKLMTFGKGKEFEACAYPLRTGTELVGSMLVMKDTAWMKRLNTQKNEFVTNISHDLRSPLSLMRGYVTLLQNIGNLSEEQQKYVNRIQMNIENMSRLVSKVLSLEMLDEDDAVKYVSFDVKEMIDETISMLELQAQQRKITIQTNYSGMKNTMLMADRVLLQQAMFNLIENAVKFSSIGGEVLVTAGKDTSWLHLSVMDHGKGIAPLDQPKLFTRFFHVDNGESYDSRGQGLGLAIVKSVADRHGGKIHVQSQLGEGSTFFLDIPLRKRVVNQ
ncbi:MAG: GAF domain-containing sensor histidine kinase [Anaerolineaceae bacterium]